MLVAVGVFGAATIVFGLSRSMPLSLACLALLGAADMFSVYVRQSLIQLYTPDAMRGRVGAVSSLFISASNELGEAAVRLPRRRHRPGRGGDRAAASAAIWLVVSRARWACEIPRAARLQEAFDRTRCTRQPTAARRARA